MISDDEQPERGKCKVVTEVGRSKTNRVIRGQVEWLWSAMEVDVEEPDHACSPDCPCWKNKEGR